MWSRFVLFALWCVWVSVWLCECFSLMWHLMRLSVSLRMLACVCSWVRAWLPDWLRECVLAYYVCSVIRTNPLVNLNWMSSKAKMSSHSQTVQLIGAALATHDWRVATKANRSTAETCSGSDSKGKGKGKRAEERTNERREKSFENEAHLTNFQQTLPNCQEYPLSKKRCIRMPCLLYCCTVIAQFSNSQNISYGFENKSGQTQWRTNFPIRNSYSESEQNFKLETFQTELPKIVFLNLFFLIFNCLNTFSKIKTHALAETSSQQQQRHLHNWLFGIKWELDSLQKKITLINWKILFSWLAQLSYWSELYGTEVKQQLTDRGDFKTDRCNCITAEWMPRFDGEREREQASLRPTSLSFQGNLANWLTSARVRGKQRSEGVGRQTESCRFNNCEGNITFDLLSWQSFHALTELAPSPLAVILSHSHSPCLVRSLSLARTERSLLGGGLSGACGAKCRGRWLAERGCLCFARCVVARAHLWFSEDAARGRGRGRFHAVLVPADICPIPHSQLREEASRQGERKNKQQKKKLAKH